MEAIGERLVLGDIDRRGSSFILVQQAVNKCPPDMVEQYLPKAQSQILTFFDYYASLAHGWDPVLKRFLTAAQGE
ncbi:MAG: hypothetical protein KBI47_12345 [Armatimonadetes bacterium]|nr:hypothetical protein [Armatimonadota bacterium]